MTEAGSSNRTRQRLWGAAVLIAIAVIVLPFLLDGAGSESQFRRVEQLREAPQASENQLPDRRAEPTLSRAEPDRQAESGTRAQRETQTQSEALTEADMLPASEAHSGSSNTPEPALTAWVVQAAAFAGEQDALAVRDQLRAAGFASFVRDRELTSDPFRVLVGPMIRKQRAEQTRKSVADLLQTDPVIMSYP